MGGVFLNELRGELLKKPDLTLQYAHDYCRIYEAAELQKFKFSQEHEPQSHVNAQSITKQWKEPKKRCKFCGYHQVFTKPSACPAL